MIMKTQRFADGQGETDWAECRGKIMIGEDGVPVKRV